MEAKIGCLKEKEVTMISAGGFLMSIAKANSPPEKRAAMMSIVIRRPYAFLEKELRSIFEGQEDVKVIVDRRHAERRRGQQPVGSERRRADRRNTKRKLVELILSA
jgi:hypothetical protein